MSAAWLVVIYLTFADGSLVQYNNGHWDTVKDYKECIAKLKTGTEELKVKYKNANPPASTFITECVKKEKK